MGEQNHISRRGGGEEEENRTRGEQKRMLRPGKGKDALSIEDFTLKTVLGRGGYGKVKQSWEAHIDAKAEVQSLVHPILAT